jgi:predicted nucleotidyltransferase
MEVTLETHRLFLLSPANVAGKRAKILLNPEAEFELAQRLHIDHGVPLGEAFAFMSGLYFRGKLAYARAFAHAPDGQAGVLIITSNRGLVSADAFVTAEELRAYSDVPIDAGDVRYSHPLVRDALALAASCPNRCSIILLGSVASGKYVDHLLPIFGQRLRFPQEFIGRGDLSRGGLLLRSVAANRMLTHVPIDGALRHGHRPPRLETPGTPKGSLLAHHPMS